MIGRKIFQRVASYGFPVTEFQLRNLFNAEPQQAVAPNSIGQSRISQLRTEFPDGQVTACAGDGIAPAWSIMSDIEV